MNSLLTLFRVHQSFHGKKESSHSFMIDFQQIYVRNVFLFCTGLGMVRSLFGENIICHLTVKSISQAFIDTKCFINGTMTVEKDTVLFHDYYQWVPIYLLLVAFGFHFPYSIWSKSVGKYVRHLEKSAENPDNAIQIIKNSKGNFIYFKTWLLELYYVVHLFLILFLTDVFFNNLWSKFGWSWGAIYKIFPDNGSCMVTYYQSSGSTEGKFNCLLPLCTVYRKIFMFFYGLFWVLIMFNVYAILYRIKLCYENRRFVNVWWALEIAKNRAITWDAEKQFDEAYKTMSCKLIKIPEGKLI